ncbi:MAG: hypothetical protein F7B20_03395 [Aeropyrum sp.]|nr:hypothetical protein [Aeropyrum sp.]MCE4615610.1 hypothetical protein [Aeropyrum sp.]
MVAEDIWGVEEYQEEAEELGGRVVYVCIRCGRQYTVDELIQAGLGYVCQTCNSRIFIKPRGSTGTVKPKRVWAV